MKIDNKKVPDSFQAYLVEGASFTKKEEYPILKEDMISKSIPMDIMPFNKCYSHKILTLDGYTKLSLDSYSTCRCIQL